MAPEAAPPVFAAASAALWVSLLRCCSSRGCDLSELAAALGATGSEGPCVPLAPGAAVGLAAAVGALESSVV
eukprot:scaffold253000_cov18-Tisochrysis_lutea.AAC.1